MPRVVFTLRPEFAEVERVRVAIEAVLLSTCPDGILDDACMEFLIASVEAMNNAVEHSKSPEIDIELHDGEGDGWSLTIITPGARFDPTASKSQMPTFEADDDQELPEGGFGLAIISQMVDALEYRYEDGKNHLTLRKSINKKNKGEIDA